MLEMDSQNETLWKRVCEPKPTVLDLQFWTFVKKFTTGKNVTKPILKHVIAFLNTGKTWYRPNNGFETLIEIKVIWKNRS